MKIRHLHSWNLSYADARTLQTQLAKQVKCTPFKPKTTLLVAGLDCAFTRERVARPKRSVAVAIREQPTVIAAVVVMRVGADPCVCPFEVLETVYAVAESTFPYIPGLLSFREAPACLKAVEKLKTQPDLFIIDGQGIAHPRRLGIASHIGLFFDRPTVGCAKSRLIGEYSVFSNKKGNFSPLTDKDETIGAVLRTKDNVKPVYVSVGHKCTLEDAIDLVLRCTTKYRLPEPTRLAHQLVTKLKKTF